MLVVVSSSLVDYPPTAPPVRILAPPPSDPEVIELVTSPITVSGSAADGVTQVYAVFKEASTGAVTKADDYPVDVVSGLWSTNISVSVSPGEMKPGVVSACHLNLTPPSPPPPPPPAPCSSVSVTVSDAPPIGGGGKMVAYAGGHHPDVVFTAKFTLWTGEPDQSCVIIPRLYHGHPLHLHKYDEIFLRAPGPERSLIFRDPDPGLYMARFVFLDGMDGVHPRTFSKLVT